MIDPQDLMFAGLCAIARQSGWRPLRADHPALELYGDDGRQLANRINRIGVRLFLAGEPGFEAFEALVDEQPAGCVAAAIAQRRDW